MAEEKETPSSWKSAESAAVVCPHCLEVECTSSGKVRRFASGVKAGFALSLINLKLEPGATRCMYVEAVKDGEEPISFGPDSVLVDYGKGWKLQAVVECKGFKRVADLSGALSKADVQGLDPLLSGKKAQALHPAISYVYIGKILVAVVFMFMLAAIFSLALENIPRLILLINSYL